MQTITFLGTVFLLSLLSVTKLAAQDICNSENVLVPNSLQVNESDPSGQNLQVEVTGIKGLRLLVYDTRGHKLFESNVDVLLKEDDAQKVDTGWDGTSLGELLESNSYVYIIEGECLNRKRMRKSGIIHLKTAKEVAKP